MSRMSGRLRRMSVWRELQEGMESKLLSRGTPRLGILLERAHMNETMFGKKGNGFQFQSKT